MKIKSTSLKLTFQQLSVIDRFMWLTNEVMLTEKQDRLYGGFNKLTFEIKPRYLSTENISALVNDMAIGGGAVVSGVGSQGASTAAVTSTANQAIAVQFAPAKRGATLLTNNKTVGKGSQIHI